MWVSDWGIKTRLPTGWGPTCRKPRGRQCERLQIPFLLSDTCLVVATSSSNARLQLLCPFHIDSVPWFSRVLLSLQWVGRFTQLVGDWAATWSSFSLACRMAIVELLSSYCVTQSNTFTFVTCLHMFFWLCSSRTTAHTFHSPAVALCFYSLGLKCFPNVSVVKA